MVPRRARSDGLLVEADHVSRRIAEPCSDLGCIRAAWLHDLSSVGHYLLNGRGHAVNHHVKQEARPECGERPSTHAPLTSPVVSSKEVLP